MIWAAIHMNIIALLLYDKCFVSVKKKKSWDEAASRSQAMKEQFVSNNIILWDI